MSSVAAEKGRDILHQIAKYYKEFSMEHEFLLNLCGGSYPERLGEIQSEAAQINWNHLFAITPPDLYGYLGHKLAEAELQSQCPALLFEETLNARRATVAQWLRLRFELRRLATDFARHNVDFLVLKGAALAFLVYPDPSVRSVSDIDVLVREEGLAVALERIYAAGFQCPERFKFAHPMSFMESALPGEEMSLPLEKPGTPVLIEVHTQLESAEPWFPVPIERIWESAEEAELEGLRVRILGQHECLFHLILHLARSHKFALGLRPLLDVHLWVKVHGESLDWKWIASESLRRGYADWVHLTLKIARDTFRTEIPLYFFEQVPPPASLDHLQRLAYEQIWADRRLDVLVPPRLAITLSQPSLTAAVSSLMRRARPSRQESLATVPPLAKLGGAGLFVAFQQVLHDFRLKLPQYARAWQKGGLRWSNLKKAAQLARGRSEIEKIMRSCCW